MIADALGANVVAIDLDSDTLARAKDVGAVATVNADETNHVGDAVTAITDGGAHISVDGLGIADTCVNSILSLRPRGQHVQIGLTTAEEGGGIEIPTDLIVRREIDFIGSLGMPAPRYDELFRMIENGSLEPSRVVSETIGIEDISSTLDSMSSFETSGIPVVTAF
jgi:threonine dehydrogenase-like Zn-dependent dehydrogenase